MALRNKRRDEQDACGARIKRRREVSSSVIRSLFRRQALGRKGRLPSTHGLPTAPSRLVYSMSKAIPAGQRHDRVLLGFTADGEHIVVCCGPLASPSRLELRRVRLQFPGLSRPEEALWALPLNLSACGGPALQGDEEVARMEADFDVGGFRMGMGGREPASVSVTESADGFLVVVVVSFRYASEMQEEEDRVYRVFVAPGPSYVDAVQAPVEFPFVGLAFSYIVPACGGALCPSIAAHDVGSVGDSGGGGGGEEPITTTQRVYAIVLNAVDTIRVLEVRLHTGEDQPPTGVHHIPEESNLPLPRIIFIGRPRGAPTATTTTVKLKTGQQITEGEKTELPGSRAVADNNNNNDKHGYNHDDNANSHTHNNNNSSDDNPCLDPIPVWWASGRDLPSSPLIGTRPLPCHRPVVTIASAVTPETVTARAGGEAQQQLTPTGVLLAAVTPIYSGEGVGSLFGSSVAAESDVIGERGGGRVGVDGNDRLVSRKKIARASIDSNRQRVFDLEVFISQLLRRRGAFPVTRQGGGGEGEGGVHNGEGIGGATNNGRISSYIEEGGGGSSSGVGQGAVTDRDGCSAATAVVAEVAASCTSAVATDYHCVTIGLLEGGRKVLLCLVIEVMYTGMGRASGGEGDGRNPGRRNCAKNSELLGYLLILDLGSGDVAVLATKTPCREIGLRCALLCDSLARSVRRAGRYPLTRPGRRLSNSALFQGRSLRAIINPVLPVAIVLGDDA